MNYIRIISFIMVLHIDFLYGLDKEIISKTIVSPIPLLQYNFQKNEKKCIEYLKKYTLPLTALFYYAIDNNTIVNDIKANPLTTISLICIVSYYISFMEKKEKKEKIKKEIINTMQKLLQILMISHGLYNKICTDNNRTVFTYTPKNIYTSLEEILCKAHMLWSILLSYYEKLICGELFYIYTTNQINLFEIIQTCNQEPDFLKQISQLYDDHIYYNYEPIIDFLTCKLALINDQIIKIIPQNYHSNLAK